MSFAIRSPPSNDPSWPLHDTATLPRMQVVSYRTDRGVRAGVLRDDRVWDVWDRLEPGDSRASVRRLLEEDRVGALSDALEGESLPLAEVELDVPVPDPEKIVCIGL